MDQAEIELLVEELELRIDRLRALYEQYFMGFERLEPSVARKDVERRVDLLRREQIRNTALKFRCQSMFQRYSTYQAYWTRMVRAIEEGTFKRARRAPGANFVANEMPPLELIPDDDE